MNRRNLLNPFFASFAIIFFLAQSGGFKAEAATNATIRALLTLSVNLTAEVQQQGDSPAHTKILTRTVSTRDVVLAIGAELGFSPDQLTGAQLIQEIAPLSVTKPPTNSFFVLKIGGTNILVSQYLQLFANPSAYQVMTDRPKVDGSDTRTEYRVFQMTLSTSNLTFNLQGQTTISSSSVTTGTGAFISRDAVPAAVSMAAKGGGKIGGVDAILYGPVGLSARTIVTATSP